MYPSRDVIMSLRDPAMTGRFLVMFPNKAPGAAGINVESIQLALTEVGHHDRSYGGQSFPFPGFASVTQQPQLNVYEDDSYSSTEYFEKWKRQVYNPDTQVYGLPRGPAGYLKTIDVFMFLVNDNKAPIARISLEDCFPGDTGGKAFDYTQTDGRTVLTVGLAIRRAKFFKM